LRKGVKGIIMDWATKWEKFAKTMESEYFQKLLLKGLENTIKVAVFGLIIGIFIGTLIAIVKVAPKYKLGIRILDKICSVYVALFRGTPMTVQLLLAYYVLLPTLGVRNVNSLHVGIIVFGMNSGAYVSEIMRGGLNSVDKGQMEAGRAVGLSYNVSMLRIVIPQAIKNILPTLGNEFIALLKETSVVSFIAVTDITKAFQSIAGGSYEYVIPYCVLALCYLLLVSVVTIAVKLMEKRFRKSDRSC
jgi:polar amino acid transport system permease protein